MDSLDTDVIGTKQNRGMVDGKGRRRHFGTNMRTRGIDEMVANSIGLLYVGSDVQRGLVGKIIADRLTEIECHAAANASHPRPVSSLRRFIKRRPALVDQS